MCPSIVKSPENAFNSQNAVSYSKTPKMFKKGPFKMTKQASFSKEMTQSFVLPKESKVNNCSRVENEETERKNPSISNFGDQELTNLLKVFYQI